jgi:hypothetical protein
MGLLADLTSGKLGLVVSPSVHLKIEDEDATSAAFDAPPGQGWWLFFFPDLHLDLDAAHDNVLERDIKRHTRALFETMSAQLAASGDAPSDLLPRTKDTSWSPLIDLERFDVEGGTALTVLHRMTYQPGHEVVMGHTLVPVRRGLFEARWMFQASLTGYRETMLHAQRNRRADDELSPLSQQAMDDPAHDTSFPKHPLTLARAARGWHGKVRVTEPPPRAQSGSRTIDVLGCTVTPPPRFVFSSVSSDPGQTTAIFTRVSFAVTDGIEYLFVTRTHGRIRGLAVGTRLVRSARTTTTAWFAQAGYTNIECDARVMEGETPSVTITLEGRPRSPGQARGRMVARAVRDAAGYVWWIALATTVAVPFAELAGEVDAVVRSWQPPTRGGSARERRDAFSLWTFARILNTVAAELALTRGSPRVATGQRGYQIHRRHR